MIALKGMAACITCLTLTAGVSAEQATQPDYYGLQVTVLSTSASESAQYGYQSKREEFGLVPTPNPATSWLSETAAYPSTLSVTAQLPSRQLVRDDSAARSFAGFVSQLAMNVTCENTSSYTLKWVSDDMNNTGTPCVAVSVWSNFPQDWVRPTTHSAHNYFAFKVQ